MSAPVRLAAFGAALVAVFAAAFGIAGAVVPERTVDAWQARAESGAAHGGGHGTDQGADHGSGAAEAVAGGSLLAAGGYRLDPVTAPVTPGADGELALRILDADGEPLTAYEESHERDLHLVVVREDGADFRHVHPTLGADGTWTLPWTWERPGSYRVFADFVPAGGDPLTLSRTVHVAGAIGAAEPPPALTNVTSGPYEIELAGELRAGEPSELTARVVRDGAPVTDIRPHLGALGHLVALREGDLAFSHVHADEDAPVFTFTPPTAGRYHLYLDLRIGEDLHSIAITREATPHDQPHDQPHDH